MLGMERIGEEYALPTLLGSSKQLHFLQDVKRTPSSPVANAFALAEIKGLKASKWAMPEPSSHVAKKKLPKGKPEPSAAERTPPAAKPKLLNENRQGRSSSSPAKPELSKASPIQSSQARTGIQPLSKAEKELMAAISTDDLKRAEALLSEFGPSLLSGLGSFAILHVARDNLKMEKLLIAQGGVQVSKLDRNFAEPSYQERETYGRRLQSHLFRDIKTEEPATHADKEGRKQFCSDQDSHTKENQGAPRWGSLLLRSRTRSASVPHISQPIQCAWNIVRSPNRSGSNTGARRRPIY